MRIVCGENDKNIAYIEDLFKTDIVLKGNRLEYLYPTDELSNLLDSLVKLSLLTSEISESEILVEYKALNINQPKEKDLAVNTKPIMVGTKAVFPKTTTQALYVNAMSTNQVVIALGPAGTGKTFLAVNYCLGELLSGRKQKIILTRPVVEAGESLGFLPGDLSQKLNPYLKPLYDSMEATISPSTISRLEDNGQIEIAPLAYMRGRSINNACVILDEAQNTTKAQMKMFLTRLGENSCAIITGDMTQIDLPKQDLSGLFDATRRLQDVEGVSIIKFSGKDTVRSRIVQRIIRAYEQE